MNRIHKVTLIFSIFATVLVAESLALCGCTNGPTVFCGRTFAFMGVVALLVTVLMGAGISSIIGISVRERMEEKLRESEERFHLLEENIQGVFWLIEGETSKLLYVSPAYENIWGRSCRHMYDEPRSWPHAVHPEDREYVRANFKDVETGSYEVKYRIVHPDNSVRWIWDRAFPILNVSGQVRHIAGIAEDITRMKQLEEELRGARDAADRANRAKSEFLAVMSHELRTPLNAVIGFSQVLADETFGELNAKQTKYVDNIFTNGHRLLQLVNEILDMVNIESGCMDLSLCRVDVAMTIDDIVNRPESWIKTSAARKNITLSAECEQSIPTVLADQPKIMQILHNLLTNAIKFTPEGGSVCVTAKQITDVSSDIQHPVSEIEQVRSGIEISILDTGIGIKPEDRERIFKEFEQADSSYGRNHQGMGLGLALTRKLIELHGGRIRAESEGEGKGSAFTFVLPITHHVPSIGRNEQ